jgi:ADP-heptose:LPS heptosyltransferase
MLATPLLSVLAAAFPNTQFDWAVSEWARPAIAKNPKIAELIPTGDLGLASLSINELLGVAEQLRQGSYDTCLIPGRSSLLSWVAWQARIPQRIGVASGGRGFAQTLVAPPRPGQQHATDIYLSLAPACGIDLPPGERPPYGILPGRC